MAERVISRYFVFRTDSPSTFSYTWVIIVIITYVFYCVKFSHSHTHIIIIKQILKRSTRKRRLLCLAHRIYGFLTYRRWWQQINAERLLIYVYTNNNKKDKNWNQRGRHKRRPYGRWFMVILRWQCMDIIHVSFYCVFLFCGRLGMCFWFLFFFIMLLDIWIVFKQLIIQVYKVLFLGVWNLYFGFDVTFQKNQNV